ncbi:MAG: hypothetical protein LBQ81_01755 [Zoogloeaceae bacterium]|nr:hypothetical protein [Zoogloeaceae bacterium]
MMGRVITGAILVLIGLLLIIANLGILHLDSGRLLNTWWPLALILLGSLLLTMKLYFLGASLLLYGLLFLAIKLEMLQAHVVHVLMVWWPLGLLVIGTVLIVNRRV